MNSERGARSVCVIAVFSFTKTLTENKGLMLARRVVSVGDRAMSL
jgi:hypothetical protein